jgi:trimeric autotransporter adhesin
MPVFQLILSSDTIEEGRIKINNAFSATTGLWSGSTGFQSLIHNNGTGNIASGDYAIAAGSGNTAVGDFSFAQGVGNLASGVASHAEGGIAFVPALGGVIFSGSSATNYGAHAQGYGALASGSVSYSNGFLTRATGIASYAIGAGAKAIGIASFAGGDNCIAFGNYSYAFGFMNSASGNSAHAEGGGTEATGDRSHAEGNATKALGLSSHAEGSDTIASGNYSHAQGYFTEASGDYSFAGGRGGVNINENVLSNGNVSFAFYRQDIITPNRGANADFSAILGGKNHYINSNSYSSVILGGENNIIDSSLPSIIIGGNNTQIINDSAGGAFYSEGGIINNNSYGTLFLTNGIINNSSFSSIENSFGPSGAVCTINNSTFCKISGRSGSNENNIDDSSNSAIYQSDDCLIDSGIGSTIMSSVGCSAVNGTRLTTVASKDCIIGYGNNLTTISSENCINAYINNSLMTNSRVVFNTIVTDDFCLIMGHEPLPINTPSLVNKKIRLNAKNGRGSFVGGAFLEAADYAEFFEWNDGNISGDTRYGYFVSLINGDKIKIGFNSELESSSDIIGIVSSNPAVVGDSAEFRWKDLYILDEWGKIVKENYSHYKTTGDTEISFFVNSFKEAYLEAPNPGNISGTPFSGNVEEAVFVENIQVSVLNPRFKPDSEYIPREERPEWSPIGLLGKLHVRTAETITGSTVSANSDGMAINGSDYHVLKQIMDFNEDKGYGVVQVLFK